MRRFWLTLASAAACATAAHAQTEAEPLVVELRLGTRSAETLAWREADGRLLVDRDTLDALGLATPAGDDTRVALQAIPGLSYSLDEANAAVLITCTAACYRGHEIGAAGPMRAAATRTQSGGFFNMDLAALGSSQGGDAAGAFELGLFGPRGAGGTTFIAGGDTGLVRLETQWTFDRPQQRMMVRLGDSTTRGGATGQPFRFGGVQIATDFSLDPGFIPFPTPTLNGEAATPSTVDLYVDGALRMRQSVDAGPFSIIDAPVLSGSGVAQVVVTDALGREQVFAQSFYSSPTMLRSGLTDYSIAAGATRLDFTQSSSHYGAGFVSAVWRHGVTDNVTTEARVEASDGHASLAAGGSVAAPWLGQVDIAFAQSEGDSSGGMSRIGWQRQGRRLSLGFETQRVDAGFHRLGEDRVGLGARSQTSASVGLNFEHIGSASIAYVAVDARNDSDDVDTISFSYAPFDFPLGHVDLTALYVNESENDPFVIVGLGFTTSLRGDINAAARVEGRRTGLSTFLSAQQGADPGGGTGWYARAAVGDIERFDAGLQRIGGQYEAQLEFSHSGDGDGLRGQFAAGVVWIDGHIEASRPVRDAFALVDVGAPNVRVLRERRFAGRTDRHGRVLLTGLRAHEPNRISLELDDLPLDMMPAQDEIAVTPASRSGVVAHFDVAQGEAGETRIIDADGAPLTLGAMLIRQSDGARFPVGTGGRVFISGLAGSAAFTAGPDCVLTIGPAQLDSGAILQCRRPG